MNYEKFQEFVTEKFDKLDKRQIYYGGANHA